MANVYTVTASTSVVLINTLQSPNTVVLLSSIVNPGHIVGIRDGTGSALIASRPIVISTTNGIKFFDGSFSTLLTQPNTSLIVSSRNPTTWQVLNNQGFFTSLSSVSLNTLTANYGSVKLISTLYDVISTLVVTDINISKNFTLSTDDYHFTDLNVSRNSVFSTISMKNGLFSTTLTVLGDVYAASSFQLKDSMTVQQDMNVASDVFIKDNLAISSSLILQSGALLSKNLSVQTLEVQSMDIAGFVRIAGNLTIGSSFTIAQDILMYSTLNLMSTLSTGGSVTGRNLIVTGPVEASTLLVKEVTRIQNDTTVHGPVSFFNSVSSFGSFQIDSSLTSEMSTVLKENFYSISSLYTSSLIVYGEAFISTLLLGTSLDIGGNLTVEMETLLNQFTLGGKFGIDSNLTVLGNTTSLDSLSTQGNLYVGGSLLLNGMFSTLSSLKVGGNLVNISSLNVADSVSSINLYVKSTLSVQGSMSIMGDLVSLSLSSSYADRSIETLNVYRKLATQNAYISYLETQSLTIPSSIYVNTTANAPYNLVVEGTSFIPGVQTSEFIGTEVQTSSLKISNSFLLGSTTSLQGNIINTDARFHSTVYSDSVFGTNLSTTTMTATFFTGDGFNLFNVKNFKANASNIDLMILSTINTPDFHATGQRFNAINTIVSDSIGMSSFTVPQTRTELTIAGFDSGYINYNTSGQYREYENIKKYSLNNGIYTTTSYPIFEGVCTSFIYNSNGANPIFIATGQDPNPLKTIQWSIDSSNWNASLQGGFLEFANDVAYSPQLSTFVAVGKGNRNIQYSGDGMNWSNVTNNFTEYNYLGTEPYHRVKWGGLEFLSIRTSPVYGSKPVLFEIKTSRNGIDWNPVQTQTINIDTSQTSLLRMNSFGFDYSSTMGAWYIFDADKKINYLSTSVSVEPSVSTFWNWKNRLPMSFDLVSTTNVPYCANVVYYKDYFSPQSTWWLVGGYSTINVFNEVAGNITLDSNSNGYQLYGLQSTAYITYTFSFEGNVAYGGGTGVQRDPGDTNNMNRYIGTYKIGGLGYNYGNSITQQDPYFYSLTPYFNSINEIPPAIQVASGYGGLTSSNFSGALSNGRMTQFLYGSGSIDGIAPVKPMIIIDNNDSNAPFSSIYTVTGVFSNAIYGMAYNPNSSSNQVVAVGDGPIPLKTIGVYSDLYSMGSNLSTTSIKFTQAFTGGFSSIGYGVTYYAPSNVWLAVGVHNFSANTIQYSVDGSNWYPTNFGNAGVRLRGTSIAWDLFKGNMKIIVTGRDPLSNNCIVVGDSIYNQWRATIGTNYFSGYQANACAITQELCYAVGTRNSNLATSVNETIKYTTNTSNWLNVTTGGFSNTGYGVAIKNSIYPYVMGGTGNFTNTIRYSSDGIIWYNANAAFEEQTNSITYSSEIGLYVAAGGISNSQTIMYSKDGKYWSYATGGNVYSCQYVTTIRDTQNVPCFWAVGYDTASPYGDKARISYDGVNWSPMPHPFSNRYWDGNYNLRGSPGFNSNYVVTAKVFGLCKISSVYVASGFGAQANNQSNEVLGRPANVAYSYDLINWSDASGGFSANLTNSYGLCYGIAVGLDNLGSTMAVVAGGYFNHVGTGFDTWNDRSAFSYDGINWSTIVGPGNNGGYQVKSVGYGGGKWVMSGQSGDGYTMYYSTDGKNYSFATSGNFDGGQYEDTNTISYNSASGRWIVLGIDATNDAKYSDDGENWLDCTGSLIDEPYYPLASASANTIMPPLSTIIVAVGDPGSNNSPHSIQYSYDGLYFYPVDASSKYFQGIGYSVTYNKVNELFYASGKQILTAYTDESILVSSNGSNWFTAKNLSNFPITNNYDYMSGFPSQGIVGTVRSLYVDTIEYSYSLPFINLTVGELGNTNQINGTSYLSFYEDDSLYNSGTSKTIRYISSFMTMNETVSFNLSNQMIITSNLTNATVTVGVLNGVSPNVDILAYPGAALTVYGSVYASSILFTGSQSEVGSNFFTSSLSVSTLTIGFGLGTGDQINYLYGSLDSYGVLSSQSLTISQKEEPTSMQAQNEIVSYSGGIQLNSLFVTPSTIGINTVRPEASLTINGTLATSTLSINSLYTLSTSKVTSLGENLNTLLTLNTSLGFFTQSNYLCSTSIIATNSNLALNNLVYFDLVSSIGIGTSSPAFSLDVRYPVNTYSILSSASIHIQVLRPSVLYL